MPGPSEGTALDAWRANVSSQLGALKAEVAQAEHARRAEETVRARWRAGQMTSVIIFIAGAMWAYILPLDRQVTSNSADIEALINADLAFSARLEGIARVREDIAALNATMEALARAMDYRLARIEEQADDDRRRSR